MTKYLFSLILIFTLLINVYSHEAHRKQNVMKETAEVNETQTVNSSSTLENEKAIDENVKFAEEVILPESNNGLHEEADEEEGLLHEIGEFHKAAVHFPIALILTALFAEVLNLIKPSSAFEHSSRFMVIAGALFSIPAAILGFIYAYGEIYSGDLHSTFLLHRTFGILTVILSLFSASTRGLNLNLTGGRRKVYFILLLLASASAIAAGYFGGELME